MSDEGVKSLVKATTVEETFTVSVGRAINFQSARFERTWRGSITGGTAEEKEAMRNKIKQKLWDDAFQESHQAISQFGDV